jgi:hypothetical protein
MKPPGLRPLITLAAAGVCGLAGLIGIGVGGAAAAPAHPIVVIVLENKTYNDIVGSGSAPYIQSLIAQGTLYTNYQAAPGSLPDYLRMTSGLDSASAAAGSNNMFHQLQTIGVAWGEYEQSMPGVCYTGSGSSPYDKGHNPAVYYDDVTSSKPTCANVVPYTAFDPTHLRAFSYVVPDDAHNMHDGATRAAQIKAGDDWLKRHVPGMVAGGARVIITWDEGNSSNEHIATIAVGGGASAGATDATAYTHYGLLAGLERGFGVTRLHNAKTATPFPVG